jgi:enoyl-CoA hydratase
VNATDRFSGYTRIKAVREGRILTLAFSNGPVNAVDAAMHHELARIFLDAQDDPECDLIVLTGEGRAFCAGGDTTWFDEQISNPSSFIGIAHEAKRIVTSLLEVEKPVICRLNGAAAGLGATIALLCDVVIMADTAKIGDPHVKVGLVAGDGGAVIWPLLVGYAKAKELLMTGDLLTAQEAYQIGLVNHVVPLEGLDPKVAEVAGKILANPKWAVRWTKTVTNIGLKRAAAEMMDASVGYEIVSNTLADRAEAVAAFKERRPGRFSGD